jgi:hypothetical protein
VKNFDWSKVEVIEVTPARARKSVEPFATVTLTEAARVAAIMDTAAQMLVWIWIMHQTKKRKSRLVAVSNSALEPYGISRKVKAAALDRLEAAGLISLKRGNGKSPVVKLLSR